MTFKPSVRLTLAFLLGTAGSLPVSAMTFRRTIVEGRQAIVAVGQIGLDSPRAFAAMATEPGTAVVLNSPGGNVGAAVSLGALFRSHGVTATVAGVNEDGSLTGGACFSACVYALVGASRRVVRAGSQVGIHRMLAGAALTEAGERLQHRAAAAALADYTTRMGVDPAMIAAAERTDPESMHVVTAGELRLWHLATGR